MTAHFVVLGHTPSVRFAASFPINGEAAGGSSWDTPLPHSWGSSAEGSEGVLQQGQIKTYPPPIKPQ
jgi:hypothetical protein